MPVIPLSNSSMAAERVREIDALGKRLCGLKLMVPHDSSFLRIRYE